MSDEDNTKALALRDEWMTEARGQTPETLPAFMAKLAGHRHDYNTIVYAAAAAAVGAAWAMDKSPMGGITGFQAGGVFWEFFRAWQHEDGPVSLRKWENMLFPQYEDHFEKAIARETWEWLRDKAHEKLADDKGYMHPEVREHLEAIAAGRVPFGYRVTP